MAGWERAAQTGEAPPAPGFVRENLANAALLLCVVLPVLTAMSTALYWSSVAAATAH